MRPLASASSSVLGQLPRIGARALSTSTRATLFANRARGVPRTNAFNRPALRQSFRRQYSEQISPETKVKAKRGGFRMLRWAWRITLWSTVAGLGYFAYEVYEMRHPPDQPDPDPSKKTLVILGL